jgi:hypothetical protein
LNYDIGAEPEVLQTSRFVTKLTCSYGKGLGIATSED